MEHFIELIIKCSKWVWFFFFFFFFFGEKNHTAKAQNPPMMVDAQSKCRCSFIKPPANGPMNALEQVYLIINDRQRSCGKVIFSVKSFRHSAHVGRGGGMAGGFPCDHYPRCISCFLFYFIRSK